MPAASPVLNLEQGVPKLLSGIREGELTKVEWRDLNALARISDGPEGMLLQANLRYAGAVTIRGRTIVSPPPFPNSTFLGLILLASGLDGLLSANSPSLEVLLDQNDSSFVTVLAALMVDSAKRLASSHIVQDYVEREDRIGVVRGRPLWHAYASSIRDGRVLCRFNEKTTNVPLNQLILAGVDAAARYLVGTPGWERRCRTQRFVWRSIAEPIDPSAHDFASAIRQLHRLSLHYRSGLILAQALLFGAHPNEIPSAFDSGYPVPIFDLAWLFEKLCERVLTQIGKPLGLIVQAQRLVRNVLVDEMGNEYRRIQPDIIIQSNLRTVAVLDAKFKPRYMRGGPGRNRSAVVERGDIYQTFFYAERLRRRERAPNALPTFIVAPVLPGSNPPAIPLRRITWQEAGTHGDNAQLRVLALPLAEIVKVLMDGGGSKEIKAAAPEIGEAMTELARVPVSASA